MISKTQPQNSKTFKVQVAPKDLSMLVMASYIAGFLTATFAMASAVVDSKPKNERKDIMFDNRKTSTIIYTVGLNALKDEIYNTDEIRAMLDEVREEL